MIATSDRLSCQTLPFPDALSTADVRQALRGLKAAQLTHVPFHRRRSRERTFPHGGGGGGGEASLLTEASPHMVGSIIFCFNEHHPLLPLIPIHPHASCCHMVFLCDTQRLDKCCQFIFRPPASAAKPPSLKLRWKKHYTGKNKNASIFDRVLIMHETPAWLNMYVSM